MRLLAELVREIKRDTVRRRLFPKHDPRASFSLGGAGGKGAEVCGEVNRKLVQVSPPPPREVLRSSNILFSVVDLTVFALLFVPNRDDLRRCVFSNISPSSPLSLSPLWRSRTIKRERKIESRELLRLNAKFKIRFREASRRNNVKSNKTNKIRPYFSSITFGILSNDINFHFTYSYENNFFPFFLYRANYIYFPTSGNFSPTALIFRSRYYSPRLPFFLFCCISPREAASISRRP